MTHRLHQTLFWSILFVLALLLLLVARPAHGQLCGASVTNYAKVGETHPFSVGAYSCAGRPDPAWQLERPDGSTIRRDGFSFSFTFDMAGRWKWFVVGYDSSCHQCSDDGTITVDGASCQLDVVATAKPKSPARELTVDFSATVTTTGPCTQTTMTWAFGDNATATGAQASHSYATIDTYSWSVTATSGGVSQRANGLVGLPCLEVGSLPFCSPGITQTKGTSGQPDSFTFAAESSLSDLLFWDAPVRYTGNPAAGTGTLAWSGSIFAKLKGGLKDTILKGSDIVYDLDAPRSQLLPRAAPLAYVLSAAGLPFAVDGKPITLGPDYVEVTPTFYVGVNSSSVRAVLASVEATVHLPKGGSKGVSGFHVLNGSITPSTTFLDMSGSYDADKDKLEGAFSIGFPFMGTWSVSVAFRIDAGCFNGLDETIGLPDPVPITGVLGIAGLTLKVDNICHPEKLSILFGGDLGIVVPPIPGEYFSINDVLAGYNAPLTLVVKGGTAKLAGYPIASLEGKISLYKPLGISLKGGIDLGGVLSGDVQTAFIASKLLWVGSLAATAKVPDIQCAFTSFGCRAFRTALESVTTLPTTVVGTIFDVYVDPTVAQYKGDLTFGSIHTVEVVEITGGQITVLVGRNYQNLYVLTLAPPDRAARLAGAERNVVIPANAPSPLIFSASAPSSVPDLTLRTPDGRTLTPSSPGAGASYKADAAVATAVYVVERPQAGTWRLSVSNVSDADTTFQVLGAVPPPELTFTSVAKNGNQVKIDATIAKTSATTKVSLLWSTTGLNDGQPIAMDLSAASGAVTATWDLTGLPPRSYYVYARVDDGLNAPRIVRYAQPVVIAGGLAAPTQLTGSLAGGAASLSWKAPSGSVAGYVVRYTDDTALPGYPLERSVSSGTTALVEGLDPAKTYRFCVAAWDAAGVVGAESSTWTTPPPSGCVVSCSAAVPSTSRAGTAASFSATAIATGCSGSPAYDWDFGDGQPHGTSANVSHVYVQAGTYSWRMNATAGSSSCAKSGSIVVSPASSGGVPGDCDGSGTVTVDEVQRAVNMLLGVEPPGCGVDTNGDGRVTPDEVQRVVNAFLGTSG